MKSKEELNAIKKEIAALNKKLSELNDEELKQVVGGDDIDFKLPEGPDAQFDIHIYDLDPNKRHIDPPKFIG